MPASLNNAVSSGPKDSAHAFHQQASTAGTYRINNILYYLLFIPIMWKVYEGKSTYRRPLLSEGLQQGAPTKPVLGSAHLFAASHFLQVVMWCLHYFCLIVVSISELPSMSRCRYRLL